MSHPVPKDLRGEERVITIPYMDLYLNKRGMIYNGLATLLSALILKLSGNVVVFFIIFLVLNIIAYPLAHYKLPRNKFEGGNVVLDQYLKRKYSYRKNKKIYVRAKKIINR